MAMGKCRGCERELSNSAGTCPSCGSHSNAFEMGMGSDNCCLASRIASIGLFGVVLACGGAPTQAPPAQAPSEAPVPVLAAQATQRRAPIVKIVNSPSRDQQGLESGCMAPVHAAQKDLARFPASSYDTDVMLQRQEAEARLSKAQDRARECARKEAAEAAKE